MDDKGILLGWPVAHAYGPDTFPWEPPSTSLWGSLAPVASGVRSRWWLTFPDERAPGGQGLRRVGLGVRVIDYSFPRAAVTLLQT